MIYYHKYGSDRFMEWATLERDDIMQTEVGDIFDFEFDNYIKWEVVNITREGKYLNITCIINDPIDEMNLMDDDDDDEYDSDDSEDEDPSNGVDDTPRPKSYKLTMRVKYKSKLEEYKVTITRPDRNNVLSHCVCRQDKYPFGKYNPYNGH